MFLLLARDPSAPLIVEQWAAMREREIAFGIRPAADQAMVDEARECARNMLVWRAKNDGKWRR